MTDDRSLQTEDGARAQAPQSDVLQQLQTLLFTTQDVTAFLSDLAMLSTQVITTERVSCGITIHYEASMLTVASSDERAERLDETQYVNHAGPCLRALQTGQAVISADTSTETRWDGWSALALQEGLRCSLSLPLSAGAVTFGAMNVYGFDRANLFGATEQHQYQLFATQAAQALRLATRQADDARLLAQLTEALNSRTVIDQAIGVLVARHQLSTDAAFDLLRQQSQNSHRKLRDIAHDLVTQATGQAPQPGRPFSP